MLGQSAFARLVIRVEPVLGPPRELELSLGLVLRVGPVPQAKPCRVVFVRPRQVVLPEVLLALGPRPLLLLLP